MPNYTEYLKRDLPQRQEALAGRKGKFADRMDALTTALKNAQSPVVSGSSAKTTGAVTQGAVGAVGASSSNKAVKSSMGKIGSIKSSGRKVKPVQVGRISQNWGASRIKYAAGRHTGMDFAAPSGTPVYSAMSGVVTRVGSEGAYGNAIHVRQADGTTALYAHLSRYNVKKGQKVKAGQGIGKVGDTGRSSGPHLHFEVRTQDRYGSDINTNSWLSRK